MATKDKAAPEGAKVDTVAAGGAVVTAVGTDAAAVAVAEAEAVGGAPAAGQGHAAEVVEGMAVRDIKVPDGGDALPRRADASAADLRRALDTADRFIQAGTRLDPQGRAVGGVMLRRSGRDEFLPLAGPTIDPAKVPGVKVAKVTAPQLRRHGCTFVAGEEVSIDFRAYSELVPIGAIEATLWDDLPEYDD